MITHLVIGASGQVGEHLVQAIQQSNLEAIGTYCTHPVSGMRRLDIRQEQEVFSAVIEIKPAVIYLPASLTNVDYCEMHPAEAYETNVTGVVNIVRAANRVGAKLVYFSSDYIFDGLAGPYKEDDPANPICEYGRQKLIAEHYVGLHCHNYLITRTTVVYGWERQGKNFIYRMLNTLRAGQPLRTPIDQIGSPTYAPNLAQVTVNLALSGAVGVYHVVGPEHVSRYAFACEAAKQFGLDDNLIQPTPTTELNQVAPRPLKAGMMVDKVTTELGVKLIDFKTGLRVMAAEERLS